MTLAQLDEIPRNFTLEGVSWDTYERLLEDIGDGHVRLTYDEGRLEIVSPSNPHERVKTIIGRLIEAYVIEAGIRLEGFGSTTYQRKDLQKGLEPDECYYIQHYDVVIGRDEFDWAIDPPPDLAIEVDIWSRSVPRQPIYAALGVPEIWRYDGEKVVSLHRDSDGIYVPSNISLAFPLLPLELVTRLVEVGVAKGQMEAIRLLREWQRTG